MSIDDKLNNNKFNSIDDNIDDSNDITYEKNRFNDIDKPKSKKSKYAIIAGIGIIGAILANTAIANREYGTSEMLKAVGLQTLYYSTVPINAYISRTMVKNIDNKYIGLTLGTIIPTSTAFGLNYLIHKIGGTPEALQSALGPVIPNLITYAGVSAAFYLGDNYKDQVKLFFHNKSKSIKKYFQKNKII